MLSIIIPTHNRLNMLQELLLSIKRQNYKDIEVIIVADACSDGTNEFLKHESFPINWRYLINDISLNAGGSRRRGFLDSKGDFVTFVDDDDYLIDNDFYIRVINTFDRYSNLSIVAANSLDKYEDTGTFERKQVNITGYIDNQKYLSGFQFKWSKPSPSFAVFRRSKLLEAGIETMYMVNDCPLYLRALLVGDIYMESDPVGVYRIHDRNISKSIGVDFIIENLKEKEYVYKELKKRRFRFDLSFWWYKMVRITVDYFMYSNPSDEDKCKVLKWCKSHIHRSLSLAIYLYVFCYISVLQKIKTIKRGMFFFTAKVLKKFLNIKGKIVNTITFLFQNPKDTLVINAWMTMYREKPCHYNLGDELNFYILKAVSPYKLYNYRDIYCFSSTNYSCIGSLIDIGLLNNHTIIWGSGAMIGKGKLNYKPLKVCAVRGKLTRKYLLEQGIDCPEIYGDPALLLPKIYQPKVEKQYKLGVIPHYVDQENPLVTELSHLYGGNVCIIKMKDYRDWKDVVDNINRCEQIISSSLHGLILSDAYNIPNAWVEFSDRVAGEGFKFKDYFSAVERETMRPICIKSVIHEEDIQKAVEQWRPISIDLQPLIQACPFVIHL